MPALIDPLVLAKINDMPLVAKTVAQGLLHGIHSSMQKGTGLEFSQYRAYEPGDALANIDWKLFARSDRYYVREAERESNVNLWLVIDASASMLHQSAKSEHGWHKFDYAKHWLATIAYIAHQQNDAIGLFGLSSDHLHFMPAYSGQQHWQKLLLQLQQMASGTVFPCSEILHQQLGKMRSNSLICVVSDFYQQESEITDFMANLVGKRTDVVALQLESDDELSFPYSGQIRFEDRETQQHLLVSAQDTKEAYLATRKAWQTSLTQTFNALNIQHCIANIDHPMDHSLYQFLAARHKIK